MLTLRRKITLTPYVRFVGNKQKLSLGTPSCVSLIRSDYHGYGHKLARLEPWHINEPHLHNHIGTVIWHILSKTILHFYPTSHRHERFCSLSLYFVPSKCQLNSHCLDLLLERTHRRIFGTFSYPPIFFYPSNPFFIIFLSYSITKRNHDCSKAH